VTTRVASGVRLPGVVRIDGRLGYSDLPSIDTCARRRCPGHRTIPPMSRCQAFTASLLNRWILDTHQGSVTPRHLQSYLEEFAFRFNHRTSHRRGLAFRRLLEQVVVPLPPH